MSLRHSLGEQLMNVQYFDLALMHLMIEKIAEERQRNDLQDVEIKSFKKELDSLKKKVQTLENCSRNTQKNLHNLNSESENAKERMDSLQDEIQMTVRRQADKIFELECRVDPYSFNGDAICNSFDDY